MILKSFAVVDDKLTPIELELILLPGLPQIHFLGLADQGIKELDRKIRSAFRQQGFEFPRAQQVVVNLRPVHLKKKSKGLDLAVAVALLMETKQIPKLISSKDYFVYGELTLSGHVQNAEDLDALPLSSEAQVLSGVSPIQCRFYRSVISELRDLLKPAEIIFPCEDLCKFVRPQFGLDLMFSEEESKYLKLVALGEHNILLAGPPGTGKSTWAKAVPSFLKPPQITDWKEIKELFPDRKIENFVWRSIIQPHHTNTVASLLGGGVPVRPGDLSRAHRGVLIMDEFLEFHIDVQEALREPVEEGVLRLSRKNQNIEFQTSFLLLATTNLCPCGQWLPDHFQDCIRSRVRCQSRRQKLSGPLLDRFDIVYLKKGTGDKKISGKSILDELEALRPNLEKISDSSDNILIPDAIQKLTTSQRRWKSIARVASSLSRLEGSKEIKHNHWEEALDYSLWPFKKLIQDLGESV
ncbi:MAG: ATP-binding protein [Bdellovibrionota bacterium]